jgi:hypothetical protein
MTPHGDERSGAAECDRQRRARRAAHSAAAARAPLAGHGGLPTVERCWSVAPVGLVFRRSGRVSPRHGGWEARTKRSAKRARRR